MARGLIAGFLMQELNQPRISFSTRHAILDAWVHDLARSIVAVDMGEPVRKWQDISAGKHGQCEDVDLDHVKLPIPDEFADYQDLQEGAVVTGFGNPHAVFVLQQDSALEHTKQIMRFCESMMEDPRFKSLFPDGVNIGFLSKADDNRLRLRVHERGAGLTLACGSGSAAAMVAAVQRGLATRSDTLSIDIYWLMAVFILRKQTVRLINGLKAPGGPAIIMSFWPDLGRLFIMARFRGWV